MRNIIQKVCIVLFTTMIVSPCGFADLEQEVQKLRAEVEALKAQIEELKEYIGPLKEKYIAEQLVKTHQAKAQERMAKDIDIYSREELREIEQLYQVANREWRTDEAKESLEKLILKYRNANRTGCAVLYLGQMSEGEEKLQYLQSAIKNHSDCYYGDGVQVGAYARFHLAHYYKQLGKVEEAAKLVDELKKQYPHAIDHRGNLLKDHYPTP